jgi:glutathione S-transferase
MLPHLSIDGMEISQSMAIARVLARRARLEGASEADFAMSEMLMEQFCDVLVVVANAKNAADQYVPHSLLVACCF